jgi:hypothetical protein|tara:strand:+ start:889 stop:1353 length:465 start_codon:yes stop_codon:yes gene_type:complete
MNNPRKTYQPLISEILDKVGKAKTKEKKIAILKENDNKGLRMILKSSFDPNIEWVFPEGDTPYTPNDVPEGTEHSMLEHESRILFNFIKGGADKVPLFKREGMFIRMLEGLHKNEAQVVIDAKDKKLHQVYKGLSKDVVRTAFGWNEEFRRIDG